MNLDLLLAPIPERTVQPCKVGRIVDELQEPYKGALLALLNHAYADGGISDEALTDRMRAAGLDVGASVVNRHRKNRCTCQKVTA